MSGPLTGLPEAVMVTPLMMGVPLMPFTNLEGFNTPVDPMSNLSAQIGQMAETMRESMLLFRTEIRAMSTGLNTTLFESNQLLHNEVRNVSSSLTATEALSIRQLESLQLLNSEIQALSGQLRADNASRRGELAAGLRELSSQLTHEAVTAITSTAERANAVLRVPHTFITILYPSQAKGH